MFCCSALLCSAALLCLSSIFMYKYRTTVSPPRRKSFPPKFSRNVRLAGVNSGRNAPNRFYCPNKSVIFPASSSSSSREAALLLVWLGPHFSGRLGFAGWVSWKKSGVGFETVPEILIGFYGTSSPLARGSGNLQVAGSGKLTIYIL